MVLELRLQLVLNLKDPDHKADGFRIMSETIFPPRFGEWLLQVFIPGSGLQEQWGFANVYGTHSSGPLGEGSDECFT